MQRFCLSIQILAKNARLLCLRIVTFHPEKKSHTVRSRILLFMPFFDLFIRHTNPLAPLLTNLFLHQIINFQSKMEVYDVLVVLPIVLVDSIKWGTKLTYRLRDTKVLNISIRFTFHITFLYRCSFVSNILTTTYE
jgi:hypothetical protein